uniref:Uncharacterized protein n=1 Tax=Esox lucius TaxID=8010 RepID=A0A6Q2YHB1_ESOLU
MSDIQACVTRLKELTGFLFDLINKKTKERKKPLKKGGVRFWWQEPNVDAKTALKIKELQPPTTNRILIDPNRATKSSSDLSFMVGNMAKSLSCKKPMSIAFKFVQNGLQNLNEAFQEQTRVTFHVDSESQRKNLELLRQAAIAGQISPELHSMTKDLITCILGVDGMRLACLLSKYKAYRSVINHQLLAARKLKDGRSVKEMYSFLTKLDVYQKEMLKRWSLKQAAIEESRKTCISHMLYLFSEVRRNSRYKAKYGPNIPINCSTFETLRCMALKLLKCPLPKLWDCSLTANDVHVARKMTSPPVKLPSIPLLMETNINSQVNAVHSPQGR